MQVGHYRIGSFPGIIKKTYEDGSIDYETNFSSKKDFLMSYGTYLECLG